MKIYVLLLNLDIQSTPCGVEKFIKVSTDKSELVELMNSGNDQINDEWDDDEGDYDGMLMSDKPYYYIEEKEI